MESQLHLSECSNHVDTMAEPMQDPGLEDPDNVAKYKAAADIANAAMKQVIAGCVSGASVRDLCVSSDAFMHEGTQKVYARKVDGVAIPRGVAFPTCISINNVVCHYSPLVSDPDTTIQDGDLVKIDLGCHVDGYIAVNAHTLVVGATAENPVTGRKADVILAAYNCCEAIARMVKPGASSPAITEIISEIASDFNCTPIKDMLCFQMTKDTITGEKSIIQNPTDGTREYDCTFEPYEVYALDVLISTGTGKGRPSEQRTSVYRKTGEHYSLRLKNSRQLYAEATSRFRSMPFTLRAFESETKARMGLRECLEHGLLEPYDVIEEKQGEFVAQFRTTVLLMPNGNLKITTGGFDPATCSSEFDVKSKATKDILATSLSSKKKKKKKSKKPAAAAAE
eukprot:m.354681 g.354681  ORF g.354681 m.354681 type:complete len:396 (+) comp17080_c0_seq1:104-1291(+)